MLKLYTIMQIRLLILILSLSTLLFSCQNKTNNPEANQQVSKVEVPDWPANKVLKQISETISSKPFEKNLILKLITTEYSLEKGEFLLELEWIGDVHHHNILLPVVPEKFYGIPFLQKDPEKTHTYTIGYTNPDGIQKEIYEVAVINNNLHFKQMQQFQLLKEPAV